MFTIGMDYGADSAPALVVHCADGGESGGAVVGYPPGDEGVLLDGSDHLLARQAPAGLRGDLRLSIGTRGAVR
jgi:L-ribulokinase